ncbi:hypothetical protein [Mycobacterium sp. P7213]|uniref:hypothetical protein n=1 Tax=Mycobacterium sp. P7213 TaxID=2478465 RepID=UPI000F644FF4|nr:hypothetical protein [Mycobacterium sp. P7213]
MATTGYRQAAKTFVSALIAAGAFLSGASLAGADDPDQPGGQGQDACASGDQSQQPQDPQACGAGIANRAIGEAQKAADQAARAAGQNGQNTPPGDRPPQDLITSTKCVVFNGAPTLIPPEGLSRTATPFDSPMEGKPCWFVFGVTPTH